MSGSAGTRAPRDRGRRAPQRHTGNGRRAQHRVISHERPREQTVLVSAALALCAISVVMVYSASAVYAQRELGSTWAVVSRHVLYVVVGVAAAWGASRIPLRTWRDTMVFVVPLVALVGLVLVQIPGMPLAPEVNGATRWIRLGPVGFQPSDLAKLALVLWLARLLSVHRDLMGTTAMLVRAAVPVAVFGALVLWGNDLGTTMLLGLVFASMYFLAGAPLVQVGAIGGSMAALGLLSVLFQEGFRAQRVMAFLQPDQHTDGAGYQVLQSQIGFASGGLFGAGPGLSRAKWGFLPEAHTDFILSVIGEELGLVGSVTVVALLVTVIGCGIVIGAKSTDPFGRLVAFGISTWLAVQALINIAVSVGAMPTKGIPLPFVSYGGTAMVVSLVAVGVLLAVSANDQRPSAAARPRPARR